MKLMLIRLAVISMLGITITSATQTSARAATSKEVAASIEEIKTRLQKSFESVKFESIAPSATWPGLYEVVTESELAYTNADGSLLFAGRILDSITRENLTARRWNEINRIDVSQLPLNHAVKTVKGDGSHPLYLFSDPDCPYCQELEKKLQDLNNVTIYTFLYPLESLHPDARAKANSIWCSADRAAAWSNWMLKQVATSATCEQNVVADNIALGMRLKINSTPTMFLADGSRVTGVVEHDALQSAIDALK